MREVVLLDNRNKRPQRLPHFQSGEIWRYFDAAEDRQPALYIVAPSSIRNMGNEHPILINLKHGTYRVPKAMDGGNYELVAPKGKGRVVVTAEDRT